MSLPKGELAEPAALEERLGGVVGGAAAALGADLEDRARGEARVALRVHRVEQHVGGIHVLGHRLLAVGVLAGVDGVRRMLGVLEVGRGDDHGVDVLRLLVKLHVAAVGGHLVAERLFKAGNGILHEALLPEVGDGDHVEVERLHVRLEAGQQRLAEAVGVADTRHAHGLVRAVVGAGGDARRGLRAEDAGQGRRRSDFHEIAAGNVRGHFFSPLGVDSRGWGGGCSFRLRSALASAPSNACEKAAE